MKRVIAAAIVVSILTGIGFGAWFGVSTLTDSDDGYSRTIPQATPTEPATPIYLPIIIPRQEPQYIEPLIPTCGRDEYNLFGQCVPSPRSCGWGERYDYVNHKCILTPASCAPTEEFDFLRKRCVPKGPIQRFNP